MSFIGDALGLNKASPKINFTPPGFDAGGFRAYFNNNGYSIDPSSGRMADVTGLQGASGYSADELAKLRSGIMPGYNDMLKSRLAELNDTASRAVGNLSQNLASRRVLGSSFGADTITRANNEFLKQRDATIADNYLKSVAASTDLLERETAARRQQFQSGLDELNLEANLASNLTNSAMPQLAANARAQAEMDMKNNQYYSGLNYKLLGGLGNFLGGFIPGGGGGFGGGGGE